MFSRATINCIAMIPREKGALFLKSLAYSNFGAYRTWPSE
jgi:hypothetical protein